MIDDAGETEDISHIQPYIVGEIGLSAALFDLRRAGLRYRAGRISKAKSPSNFNLVVQGTTLFGNAGPSINRGCVWVIGCVCGRVGVLVCV